MQSKSIETSTNESGLSDVLVRLTLSLSSVKDFPKSMTRALQIIGEYSHHDRVHIVKIHQDMTFAIQYEWNSKGLSPVKEELRHQHLIYDSPLEEQLCNFNYIRIDESDEPLHSAIRAYLQEQACHRMLILPLFECGSQFAFIVFMQCREIHPLENEDIKLLIDFSSLIASRMHHQQLIRHLYHVVHRQEEVQEPQKILHTRLKQLHAEIIPTWEQIKNEFSSSDSNARTASVTRLEQHLLNLDKICRVYL